MWFDHLEIGAVYSDNALARQTRSYGSGSNPKTDVDYGHDHAGAGDPHAHDWGQPDDGSAPTASDRGTARPVQPSDPKPNPNP